MKLTTTYIVLAVVSGCLLASPCLAQAPTMTPTGQQAATATGQKDAQSIISSWPDKTKKAAQALIDKYGQPDGAMDTMLVWNDKGDWKQITVYRDPVKHNEPMPHEDFLENTVSYHFPKARSAIWSSSTTLWSSMRRADFCPRTATARRPTRWR